MSTRAQGLEDGLLVIEGGERAAANVRRFEPDSSNEFAAAHCRRTKFDERDVALVLSEELEKSRSIFRRSNHEDRRREGSE